MSFRGIIYPDHEAAEEIRQQLSHRVEMMKKELRIRQGDISTESGVNASMLSQWMLGRYKGNVARINGIMEKWMIRRQGRDDPVRNIEGITPPEEKDLARISPANENSIVLKDNQNLTLLQSANKRSRPEDAKSALISSDKQREKKQKTLSSQAAAANRMFYQFPKKVSDGCCLLPIRIDVDSYGRRIIDTFTWNLFENDFTFETFALALVQDLDLPHHFSNSVADTIRRQVEHGKKHILRREDRKEKLVLIKLNIRVKDIILRDQFEWDLKESSTTPERFAKALCADLSLSHEFESRVAISIRQQLKMYSKLIYEGRQDHITFMQPVSAVFRDCIDIQDWGPRMEYLTAEDIRLTEREDMIRSRPRTDSTSTALPTTSVTKVEPVRKQGFHSSIKHKMITTSGPSDVPKVDKGERPPKPLSSFLMFCRKWRKLLSSSNPNIAKNPKEMADMLGKKWHATTPEERREYEAEAKKESAKRLLEWQERPKHQT